MCGWCWESPALPEPYDFHLPASNIRNSCQGPIRSFGETLGWYIAEVFKREFCAKATWRIKLKRPNDGGDYGIIAKFGNALLYAWKYSSPPKQIYDNEIAAFSRPRCRPCRERRSGEISRGSVTVPQSDAEDIVRGRRARIRSIAYHAVQACVKKPVLFELFFQSQGYRIGLHR
jgi:hypothetical protein